MTALVRLLSPVFIAQIKPYYYYVIDKIKKTGKKHGI